MKESKITVYNEETRENREKYEGDLSCNFTFRLLQWIAYTVVVLL